MPVPPFDLYFKGKVRNPNMIINNAEKIDWEKLVDAMAQEPYVKTHEPFEYNVIMVDRKRNFTVSTYMIDPSKLPCSCNLGKSGKYMFARPEKQGIYYTCGACRMTHGVLPVEDMQFISKRRLSTEQAVEFVDRTGQSVLQLVDV